MGRRQALCGGVMQIHYIPPGPVGARYLSSAADISAIMGPVGSGKTSCSAIKIMMLARSQAPSTFRVDAQGRPVRMFKACVVRDTYRQLWSTTIPSWWEWMPKANGSWSGSPGEPATHTVMMPLPDGTVVELIVEFIAIGEHKVEDVLRGYQPTLFYLNEADLLAEEVFHYCVTRTGRYPGALHGGPTWHGIIMDFNAPDTESWIYTLCVDKKPENLDFFVQPSGLSPEAENRKNLPADYYERMRKTMPEWQFRRLVENQFGYSRDGKPVYGEFRDSFHISPTVLDPIPGLKVHIGIDGGGSPSVVINQQVPGGQWRTLDELVTEQGTGPTRFGQALSRLLNDRYRGFETTHGHVLLNAWADPAAFYGADKDNGEGDFIRIVQNETGLTIRAAPTNNPVQRIEAVRRPLTRLIDDARPGLLISSHCKVMRRGYNSGYRLRRLHIPGATRFSDEPEKNEWSHPHDANQYSLCGGGEYHEVLGRKAARSSAPRATHAVTDGTQRPSSARPGRHTGPASY
jgi:hypothetical protein